MKHFLLICSFLLICPILCAVEVSKCIIYHAPSAPARVKAAAQELQDYLTKATGTRLRIQTTPHSPMIALGDCLPARKAGIEGQELKYEEYIIRTVGKDLYIVGRDVPNDGKNEFYGDSFGTRYAVYDFLEKVIGIRWLIPGPWGTENRQRQYVCLSVLSAVCL